MGKRIGAAVALMLVVAGLGACSPKPRTPLSSTASVAVNGRDTNFQIVNCTQVEWFRTIHIGGDFSGATVQIDERREPAIAQSVRIQNVGGFTGMYSQGDGSDGATTNLNSGKFTIAGTAHGSKIDKPTEPATADFKIIVAC